jgi:hypothetical protein
LNDSSCIAGDVEGWAQRSDCNILSTDHEEFERFSRCLTTLLAGQSYYTTKTKPTMKFTIVAALIASASAFAPQSSQPSTIQLNGAAGKAAFGNELGAQVPLGFWDPLGLTDDADQANFDRLRWVELKHGRIAMLAVVGYLVTYAGIRFPGAEDIPAGFAALDNLPGMVWAQLVATWAMMEAANQSQAVAPWGYGSNAASAAEFKGDFRNGALDFGWDKQVPTGRTRNVRLN